MLHPSKSIEVLKDYTIKTAVLRMLSWKFTPSSKTLQSYSDLSQLISLDLGWNRCAVS